jgi:hypothetical protein
MRLRTTCHVALAIAVVALAAWRVACVAAGPDVDTDAYAHHMIARAILADPRDLAVHWVWLPLFHYLQVPLVAAGGTMDDVRWLNVALAAALPVVLFAYVRRTAAAAATPGVLPPEIVALLAAVFAAACPITMQMGTTAQPEPLFALVMLLVATAYEEGRYGAAAWALAVAVLLRYEAWAALLTIGGLAAGDRWLVRWRLLRPRGGRGVWKAIALPVAAILGWAVLRRPIDGRWFGFLGQTHEFASGALHERSALDGGFVGLLRDSVHYPIVVPARIYGPALLLAPFGVARTVAQQGARFVLVLASCLAFVSFTWITRSSLGLDRHFVVVVALYAVFAAQGAAAIADAAGSVARRRAGERGAVVAGRAAAAVTGGIALLGLAVNLELWMRFWHASIAHGFPERTAAGAYLRSIPGDAPVFCDDATIEILSGLDRRRFDRHWIDDDHTWDLVEEAARARGGAYVATWARKLVGHEDRGAVVFRAGQTDDQPASGIAVMRVGDRRDRTAR